MVTRGGTEEPGRCLRGIRYSKMKMNAFEGGERKWTSIVEDEISHDDTKFKIRQEWRQEHSHAQIGFAGVSAITRQLLPLWSVTELQAYTKERA